MDGSAAGAGEGESAVGGAAEGGASTVSLPEQPAKTKAPASSAALIQTHDLPNSPTVCRLSSEFNDLSARRNSSHLVPSR